MTDHHAPDFATLALTERADGVIVQVRVISRGGREQIDGVGAGILRVRLTAPPVDGAANKALQRFLATVLHQPKGAITIASGAHSRQKMLLIAGLSGDQVRQRLASWQA